MRALFVASHFPEDLGRDVHGAFQRMYAFMEAAGRVAETMDVLVFPRHDLAVEDGLVARCAEHFGRVAGVPVNPVLVPKDAPRRAGGVGDTHTRRRLRDAWRRLCAIADPFASEDLEFVQRGGPRHVRALQACLARRPDFLVVHHLPAMALVLRSGASRLPILFDLDDIEHWKCARDVASIRDWRLLLDFAAILAAERAAVRASCRSYVCSDPDADYMRRICPGSSIEALPNSVPIPPPSEPAEEKALLFLGNHAYRHNAIAAEFLVREIWPRVLLRVPDATLVLAGAGSERLPSRAEAPPGVRFEGFVEDLGALYRRTRAVCCPLRNGGGTRIKIIEAAAHGRPVVSTRVGAEGLDLRDGCEILLRDTPEAFAEACAELLADRPLCRRIGGAARDAVAPRHSRDGILQQLQASLAEAVAGRARTRR
jgi:glycosyltransferase involved in cell wall biosynthesis